MTKLTVSDDGVGIHHASSSERLREGHLGLAVVQDRLLEIGGAMNVSETIGGGASVRACIPHRH